jgi:F-type H+-transporting ATPase subunit a
MNQKPTDPKSEQFDQGISTIKQWFQDKPHHSFGTDTKTEHVPLAPEVIGHIGYFPITNSLVFSFLVTILLSLFAIVFSRKITVIPGKLQSLIEVMFEYVYDLGESLAKSRIKSFFPWVMTFFIYILAANLLALFPGVSTIGVNVMQEGQQKFIPLLRSINSDLNMTLSLALLSVMATHFFSLKFIGGINYLKRWFSLKMFGVFLFVGILELVSEFTKIISLSFRLFGNILAGKVLLKTSWSVSAFIVPLPFYFLELVVAFVQAAVFMILTLIFMVMLSEKHHS